MRERLTIGEAAKLAGVTPKAVRHYHKLGLLAEPGRSEAGYRLYGARDLMRLARIRRLRSLDLPLKQVGIVLGEPPDSLPGAADGERPLRAVLESLREETSREIRRLEERRARIEELLAGGDPEASEKPYALKLAEKGLAEHLSEVNPELLEQDRKLWAALDALEWPAEYQRGVEATVRYYADHPDEYQALTSLTEPLVLADLPVDSPEIKRLAREFARCMKAGILSSFELAEDKPMPAPLEAMFRDVMLANLSPAQQRFWALVEERLTETDH